MLCQLCGQSDGKEIKDIIRFNIHVCRGCVKAFYDGWDDAFVITGPAVERVLHNLIGRNVAVFGQDYPDERAAYGNLKFSKASASYLKDLWHVEWNALRTDDIVAIEIVPVWQDYDPDLESTWNCNVALYEWCAYDRLRFYQVDVYRPDGRQAMRSAWVDVNKDGSFVIMPNIDDDVGRPIPVKTWGDVFSFSFSNGRYELVLGEAS